MIDNVDDVDDNVNFDFLDVKHSIYNNNYGVCV